MSACQLVCLPGCLFVGLCLHLLAFALCLYTSRLLCRSISLSCGDLLFASLSLAQSGLPLGVLPLCLSISWNPGVHVSVRSFAVPQSCRLIVFETREAKHTIIDECATKIPGVTVYLSTDQIFLMSTKAKTIEPRCILGGCLACVSHELGRSRDGVKGTEEAWLRHRPLGFWAEL